MTRRPLRAGDHVAVVAPAGPIPADLLEQGVAVLRDWGLAVTVATHVTDRHPTFGYLAGTDADRAADLQQAWCDPQVAAVVCARGGYGCLRLLPHLDWAALAGAAPKPLIGSSDVTVLHHAFGAALGVPTVFGPMPASGWFTGDTRAALRQCLFDPDRPTTITGPDAGPLAAGTGGVAHGVTAGGTASLLAALAGATGPVGHPPPDGSILLLEDITESPYRLDRIITQLMLAGWLDRVAGIALGSWTGCGPLPDVRAVLADRLAGLGVPVAWGLTFGHCAGQATIRLGAPAVLDADTGRLTVN
ncbi:MAG TPA: LD-carboxypeptidase [Pseudonocardiaceae bacterium]|nr:LD-carboxypeptidase [Pseudonocardiaceae bacterium]